MTRHVEACASIAAPPENVFAHLDDQRRLGEHMGEPSLMMGGGTMTYELDAGGGQAVGSHIRMGGRAFGLKLDLDEVVTERSPPSRKVWRTTGEPRLVVIGGYEMGFALEPQDAGSVLRVWIDYQPPSRGIGRVFPSLGAAYARWCVSKMVRDAVSHFGRVAGPRSARRVGDADLNGM